MLRDRNIDMQARQQPLLLISANSAWNILHFRMDLIRALQQSGYRIAVAAPADEQTEQLEQAGVQFVPLPMSPSGRSPVRDGILLLRYWRLMRRLEPHAFLGFTAKPNVYGSLAARLQRVPAINNITGLGTAFIHGGGLERLVSALYGLALRRSETVFFHNPDDRDLFVSRKLVAPGQAALIPGSGIDLERYAPAPLPGSGARLAFLFVGRLLWEKGVREFVDAARIVKRRFPEARFRILGAFAEDERAVSRAQVDQWVGEGIVDYLGSSDDVRPHLEAADCVVLPSWREGLPRVLLEAAAMGRPAIASDAPGCRHAIVDGATGFLCKARSSEALARGIERMIALPPAERAEMGRGARAHAEEQFGIARVWSEYLSVLGRIRGRH